MKKSQKELYHQGVWYSLRRWISFDVCEYIDSGILSDMIVEIVEVNLLPHWGVSGPVDHFVFDVHACLNAMMQKGIVTLTATHFIYNEWRVKGYLFQAGRTFLHHDPLFQLVTE